MRPAPRSSPPGVTQLDLTSTASNEEPLQPVSYRRLLFSHNEQTIIMGVLTDVTVAGPIDPTHGPADAGARRHRAVIVRRQCTGVDTVLQGIRDGGTHVSPAELRLISEWVDIGAQYFNNPFDPAAPKD